MGFFDNLKEALGADKESTETPTAESGAQPSMDAPRHAADDVPVESEGDAAFATGGKHALRD